MESDLFPATCDDIELNYKKLGHNRGYRFLMYPKCTFSKETDIAVITANPGGDIITEHPSKSCENGNAYFTESWKNSSSGQDKLQIEMQILYKVLSKKFNFHGTPLEFSNSKVLSAYFIPFRSKDLNSLHNKRETFEFAQNMWYNIFSNILPKLIITIGNDAYQGISDVFELKFTGKQTDKEEFDTGWGTENPNSKRSYKFNSTKYVLKNNKIVTIAKLPHLSRFTVMTSGKCTKYTNLFLEHITQYS